MLSEVPVTEAAFTAASEPAEFWDEGVEDRRWRSVRSVELLIKSFIQYMGQSGLILGPMSAIEKRVPKPSV